MSKTFDFQGGGKNIRIADIASDADVVVSAAKPVSDFEAERIQHRALTQDQGHAVPVLFLLASPKDMDELWLDEEMRAVKQSIEQAAYGSSFRITYAFAPRPAELVRQMSRYRPKIVHFSGHSDMAGLAFAAEAGGNAVLTVEQVAAVFDASEHVELAVLNSCESAAIAEALANRVGLTVGMSQEIGDEGAQTFASGFYASLGSGDSVETAFRKGKTEMRLAADPGAEVPRLYARRDVDPGCVIFTGPDATAS